MKNSKGYKLFNFITKIISWCIMAILCVIGGFLVIYIAVNKIAQAQGKSAPLGLYTIISPSMTPDIDVYDVVVVIQKDPEEIEIGDIISYYSTNSYFGNTPITHRVVEKFNTNNGVSFRTRGDANPVVDNEIVMSENVIGTVRFVIPQLGRIQFFLASKGGWFIAILIPAVGIIVYDLIKLSKLMAVKRKIKNVEQIDEEEKPIIQEKDEEKSVIEQIDEEEKTIEDKTNIETKENEKLLKDNRDNQKINKNQNYNQYNKSKKKKKKSSKHK